MKKKYARLTVDMSLDEHTYLKMASAQMGVSMRKFILLSAFERMREMDDEWLKERAGEAISGLSSVGVDQSEQQSFT